MGGGGRGGGGQGGCERKIEVFEKIHKKKSGGGVGVFGLGGTVRIGGCSGWGVRADVDEELNFFYENKKNGGGSGRGAGSGRGVRLYVKEELKFL